MLKQQIKSLGIKNIHIRDPHSDIRRNYKSADIFVCTSTSEAGPMTVWEAMSMEKAVVSTDVGDVSAVMSNGKSGYIVPTKDSRKIAEKIACLIDNDSVRSELGRSARLAAIEKVDTKICAKSQIDAYTRIVDRSKLIN
jgi:glycosyltransferase involved in cell wall biosynthesis